MTDPERDDDPKDLFDDGDGDDDDDGDVDLDADESVDTEEDEIVETRVAPGVVKRSTKKQSTATEEPDVTRAKKTGRRTPINELPQDEINSLKDSGITQINLRVIRRNPAGQYSTIEPGLLLDVVDLVNGNLEQYLDQKAGGGVYLIQARDINDPTRMLLPQWQFHLPGNPRDPKMNAPHMGAVPFNMQQGQHYQQQQQQFMPQQGLGIPVPPQAYQIPGVATPQMLAAGQITMPPQDQLPAWARPYPATQQWPIYYEQLEKQGRLPAGASVHSDALAQGHAQQWQTQWAVERADAAKLDERLKAAEEAHARETKELTAKIDEMRAERDREKYEGSIAAMRAEIASLRDAPKVDQSKTMSEIAKIFGPALVATAPAFISMLVERSRIERDSQFKQQELSQNQTATMLATLNKPAPSTDWPTLLTAIMPIALKVMESKSPQAEAELMDMKHQSQMMQFKMMSDLILSHFENQPEQPAWLPVVQMALEAIGGFGDKMAAKAMMGGGAPQQLPAQGSPGVATANVVHTDDSAVWAQLMEVDPAAAQMTKLVWDNVPAEAGFQTHEWRLLIFNIHRKIDVEELAPKIADHLVHLSEYHMLPPPLVNVFGDPTGIVQIVMGLPVAQQDAAYAKALADALVLEINERTEVTEDDIADAIDVTPADDGSNGAVMQPPVPDTTIVTPVPAEETVTP